MIYETETISNEKELDNIFGIENENENKKWDDVTKKHPPRLIIDPSRPYLPKEILMSIEEIEEKIEAGLLSPEFVEFHKNLLLKYDLSIKKALKNKVERIENTLCCGCHELYLIFHPLPRWKMLENVDINIPENPSQNDLKHIVDFCNENNLEPLITRSSKSMLRLMFRQKSSGYLCSISELTDIIETLVPLKYYSVSIDFDIENEGYLFDISEIRNIPKWYTGVYIYNTITNEKYVGMSGNLRERVLDRREMIKFISSVKIYPTKSIYDAKLLEKKLISTLDPELNRKLK